MRRGPKGSGAFVSGGGGEFARNLGHLLGAGRPAVVEAHRGVRVAVLGVGVEDGRGIARLPVTGVGEGVDCGEREAVAAVCR